MKDIVSLSSDAELATILAAFHLAMANNDLSMVSFRIFMFNKPEKKVITLLSTDITDEERKNAIEDDYGVKYTADGLKLISAPHDTTAYIIKKGTERNRTRQSIFRSQQTRQILERRYGNMIHRLKPYLWK